MVLNLKDYNIPENTVATAEIQAVLDEATEKGGLTVVIPDGKYITGTLNMGSSSLYLEKGAVLKGSSDFSDYRPNGFVHNEMHDTISLIYSMSNNDIAIYGEGTIDLSSEAFYDANNPLRSR